jgi:hypothetical protein
MGKMNQLIRWSSATKWHILRHTTPEQDACGGDHTAYHTECQNVVWESTMGFEQAARAYPASMICRRCVKAAKADLADFVGGTGMEAFG